MWIGIISCNTRIAEKTTATSLPRRPTILETSLVSKKPLNKKMTEQLLISPSLCWTSRGPEWRSRQRPAASLQPCRRSWWLPCGRTFWRWLCNKWAHRGCLAIGYFWRSCCTPCCMHPLTVSVRVVLGAQKRGYNTGRPRTPRGLHAGGLEKSSPQRQRTQPSPAPELALLPPGLHTPLCAATERRRAQRLLWFFGFATLARSSVVFTRNQITMRYVFFAQDWLWYDCECRFNKTTITFISFKQREEI